MSGSIANEAADLQQRVQRGELSMERLRLAAQLGSRAAADALGAQAPARIKLPPRGPFEPGFEGGVEGVCRCFAAMAWYAFEHSESPDPLLHRSVRRSVRDFEKQLFAQGDPAQIGLRMEKKTERYLEPKSEEQRLDDDELESADPLIAVLYLLVAIQGTLSRRPSWTREEQWKRTWDAFFYGAGHKLNEVLREEVLPWALGRSDPFRERYQAREAGA